MRQLVEFRDRRDWAANWAAKNPILQEGEHGYERDSGRFKIGDGVQRWLQLPYFYPGQSSSGGGDSGALADHINDPEPHPIYDDGPSLVLIYQNAKV